jgi:hypothetical protein
MRKSLEPQYTRQEDAGLDLAVMLEANDIVETNSRLHRIGRRVAAEHLLQMTPQPRRMAEIPHGVKPRGPFPLPFWPNPTLAEAVPGDDYDASLGRTLQMPERLRAIRLPCPL